MMTINRPLRVFLCYSSNDRLIVRELYEKLRVNTWIESWLDEENIYPGQDWNLEIEKAIEATDLIIVFLSNSSITKEGYVQREIRIALDYAEFKPDGTLFIIPIRLEECKPPKRLARWQYADYFENERERAFQRLLISLKKRAAALGLKDVSQNDAPRLIEKTSSENETPISTLDEIHQTRGNLETIIHDNMIHPNLTAEINEQSDILKDTFTPKNTVEPKQRKKPSQKKKPIVETVKSMPYEHPTLEWIAANKITLSNKMEFMCVPAGKFLMGNNDQNEKSGSTYLSASPEHEVNIPYDYWMGRFPITNELYDFYVKAKGGGHLEGSWEGRKDHPVSGVDDFDAAAYCRWLNDLYKTELPVGLVLRLPTEAEWEKAARGIDGRQYPWGNEFDINKCNIHFPQSFFSSVSKQLFGWTTPVTKYTPQGDSPYGCADMIGNLKEWAYCLSRKYPYKTDNQRKTVSKDGSHYDCVLRTTPYLSADSYESIKMYARCSERSEMGIAPKDWFGFRVALAPPL